MRLFEATGVGTLLLTDAKVNLPYMFTPGKEVVAYRTTEECVELARYYLENEAERRAIAQAGQQRTLAEHTYFRRMQELVDILGRHLRKTGS
jgi:spore maturation protein CgeB